MSSKYDLDRVVQLILQHGYTRVAIQFPDELLSDCVPVYEALMEKVAAASSNGTSNDSFGSNRVEIFITADSTWGSSIDDVSAMHYDATVLVYFGSDLSSSGSMPVIVVPPMKPIDVGECCLSISKCIANLSIGSGSNHDLDPSRSSGVFVFYEPSYHGSVDAIMQSLQATHSQSQSQSEFLFTVASLPCCSDLADWSPEHKQQQQKNSTSSSIIGGLILPEESIRAMNETIVASNRVLIYIGDKQEQKVNVLLNLAEYKAICYSPASNTVDVTRGSQTLDFRQRYGGHSKVEASNVIGIIVGSMGFTADLTNGIMSRLQQLIQAADKKYYCFVMGRLNEAKLCNFPEIDVFCLISNDDCAVIKPKVFHKPVITPFELELGLGARDWNSSYSTDIAALLGNGEEDLKKALAKVREMYGTDESDEDEEATKTSISADDNGQQLISSSSSSSSSNSSSSSSSSKNGAVVLFDSAAGDFFRNREYQGLVPMLADGGRAMPSTEIQAGQFGTAKGYRQGYSEGLSSVEGWVDEAEAEAEVEAELQVEVEIEGKVEVEVEVAVEIDVADS